MTHLNGPELTWSLCVEGEEFQRVSANPKPFGITDISLGRGGQLSNEKEQ